MAAQPIPMPKPFDPRKFVRDHIEGATPGATYEAITEAILDGVPDPDAAMALLTLTLRAYVKGTERLQRRNETERATPPTLSDAPERAQAVIVGADRRKRAGEILAAGRLPWLDRYINVPGGVRKEMRLLNVGELMRLRDNNLTLARGNLISAHQWDLAIKACNERGVTKLGELPERVIASCLTADLPAEKTPKGLKRPDA